MTNGTRRGWGVSATPRPLFTPGKYQVLIYKRLCGSHVWSGQVRNISPPTGIRSPDRPASSQLLYRLRYPVPPSPLCTEENQAQLFSWRISESHDFRENINVTISVTCNMPAHMAFRWVELFAFSDNRLRFACLFHHHHHHVQEGFCLIPVPCILKMKLVPPSLPRSSYVSSSFWFIL
jgi:hypothetical protein